MKRFSIAATASIGLLITAAGSPGASSGDYLVLDLSPGPAAERYAVETLSDAPAGGWTDEYKTTRLVLRLISPGKVRAGSPVTELGHWLNETQRDLVATQAFYIGVFEVTQKQWERVMGTWPGYVHDPRYRDARPVERVSFAGIRGRWNPEDRPEPDTFLGRLRARTGLRFDLPLESQWEYAGRAGTTTALNSGSDLSATNICPKLSLLGRYAGNGGSNRSATADLSGASAKVGSYLPNAWGLYDFHGNVWEWCLDWYETYPGLGPFERHDYLGAFKVLRGGGWDYPARCCRVATRFSDGPFSADISHGFRIATPAGLETPAERKEKQ